MNVDQIKDIVLTALDDLKGKDIVALNVSEMTDITDYMVICTGTSNRHLKSLADNVEQKLKKLHCRALGVEGAGQQAEWILVDFGFVVVHIMLPDTRDFYDLERLWSIAVPVP